MESDPTSSGPSMPERDRLRAGEPVILVDRKGRKYLAFVAPGGEFNLRGGAIRLGDLVGLAPGSRVKSSIDETITVHRALLEDYVLLMPRGATVVPPKDIGFITIWGDIFPGAAVVEAGLGSGALTLGLLRAVGPAGRVISYDLRDDFARCARKNIAAWPEGLEARLEIRIGDIHKELETLSGIDRLVLDLPDPWLALPGAARALRPGGLLIAYLPTIRQIDQLLLAILDRPEFSGPEVTETIHRPWAADRERLRPSLRIAGHSGFLLRARRGATPSAPDASGTDGGLQSGIEEESGP